MDYVIRREPAELDSTGYIEIGAGQYSGKHWQHGFLFIWEDAFGMAEGILAKHFPNYNHFSMNNIPKEVGTKVVEEWEKIAEALSWTSPTDVAKLLNLDESYRMGLENECGQHKDEIAAMLKELAIECRSFYQAQDWICVLGI